MPPRSAPSRHDLDRVPNSPGGYATLAISVHNGASTIAPVAVPDVYDGRRRVRALARIDFLDRECRAGRFDAAALAAGRDCERVFEHMTRIGGGGQWLEGDRLDQATAADMLAVLGVQRAREVNLFLGWLVRQVGVNDTRLLWFVLGDRLTLAAAALSLGRPHRRGLRYTRDRFADALRTLAEAKAAKGKAVHGR